MDIIDLVVWLPWAFGPATLLAAGAAATGRWELARRTARAVVASLLMYVPFVFALITILGSGDASAKATLLARVLSQLFDDRVFSAMFAAAVAPIIWFLAARRVRGQQATPR